MMLAASFLWFGCETKSPARYETKAPPTGESARIAGRVVNEEGRGVASAVVRKQASQMSTRTDEKGEFVLVLRDESEPEITVSAWKDGYYCAKEEGVAVPSAGVELELRTYQSGDNPEYEWFAPVGEESCASCKPEVTAVWLSNAHAKSARNPRFISMYEGSTTEGARSPKTDFFYNRDYGGDVPVPPGEDEPYYGPGYKLDFPEKDGNCAACHTPGAAAHDPYGTDPTEVTGADTYGVHCDFCHKIADVQLDPQTKMPYAGAPGVLSVDLRRPFHDDPEREQLFFGPFDDDNVPEEDTRLPLIEESAFCASCHFGEFWGTVAYNSYGEWLESEWSDPETGKTCQECHMPAPTVYEGEVLTNVAEGHGGVERDPMSIRAHSQLGALDREFLENALSVSVETERTAGEATVRVELINDNTGHHIPTGTPLRHMILVLRGMDGEGGRLPLKEGPVLPEWCGKVSAEKAGEEAFEAHAFAGFPGKVYAKVLKETWTQKVPTGAYWNPTTVVKDTRLAAFESDEGVWTFTLERNGKSADGGTVEVLLLLRRAYYELMKRKKWDTPDVPIRRIRVDFAREERQEQ